MSGLEARGLRLGECPSQLHRRLKRVVRSLAHCAKRRQAEEPCPVPGVRCPLHRSWARPLEDPRAFSRTLQPGKATDPRRVQSQVDEVGPSEPTWRASGGFHFPFPSELQTRARVPRAQGGGRIPGLETSTRSEGPGLRPPLPPPPGPPPGAAASPGGASFCRSAPPSFPGAPGSPRSSQKISAPARPPPTSKADQTAPMAERLRETTGPRTRARLTRTATPTPPAPAFYGSTVASPDRPRPTPRPAARNFPRRGPAPVDPTPALSLGKGLRELRGARGLRDQDSHSAVSTRWGRESGWGVGGERGGLEEAPLAPTAAPRLPEHLCTIYLKAHHRNQSLSFSILLLPPF